MKKKALGLLTGGGDCPGLNAVIRAVVQTGIRRYGYRVLGIVDGFEGLVRPDRIRELGLDDVHAILPLGGTMLGTTNRSNPFRYGIEQADGSTVYKDMSDNALENFHFLGLDGLVVIGGDGTLTIAHELATRGLRAVGVPKTIDNDLEATDVTFGFDSAVTTAVDALDKLRTTAESHRRVMILEVMGRNAGWIALYAGIAGGAHAILVPEIPYQIDTVVRRIEERERNDDRNYTLIVIAEGAAPEGEKTHVLDEGAPIHSIRHIDAGLRLKQLLDERIGRHEIRVTVLGHLQRGGSPTAADRILGTRFGVHAVECIHAGDFDQMVTLRDGVITHVPLAEAAGQQRLLPPDHSLMQAARQIGVIFGDGG